MIYYMRSVHYQICGSIRSFHRSLRQCHQLQFGRQFPRRRTRRTVPNYLNGVSQRLSISDPAETFQGQDLTNNVTKRSAIKTAARNQREGYCMKWQHFTMVARGLPAKKQQVVCCVGRPRPLESNPVRQGEPFQQRRSDSLWNRRVEVSAGIRGCKI